MSDYDRKAWIRPCTRGIIAELHIVKLLAIPSLPLSPHFAETPSLHRELEWSHLICVLKPAILAIFAGTKWDNWGFMIPFSALKHRSLSSTPWFPTFSRPAIVYTFPVGLTDMASGWRESFCSFLPVPGAMSSDMLCSSCCKIVAMTRAWATSPTVALVTWWFGVAACLCCIHENVYAMKVCCVASSVKPCQKPRNDCTVLVEQNLSAIPAKFVRRESVLLSRAKS